jgi:hypothetical protein
LGKHRYRSSALSRQIQHPQSADVKAFISQEISASVSLLIVCCMETLFLPPGGSNNLKDYSARGKMSNSFLSPEGGSGDFLTCPFVYIINVLPEKSHDVKHDPRSSFPKRFRAFGGGTTNGFPQGQSNQPTAEKPAAASLHILPIPGFLRKESFAQKTAERRRGKLKVHKKLGVGKATYSLTSPYSFNYDELQADPGAVVPEGKG